MIDLTPLDVRNKRGDFKKIMRGYDPQEVDIFLELVAERLEMLVRETLDLRDRTQSLEEQVSQQADRERAVQDALVSAQGLRADIEAQSQREAEHILREAQSEAKQLRTSAEAEVRRMLLEADEEVRNRVRGIERRVDQASASLEELERGRLRFLKEFASLLDREREVVRVELDRTPFDERTIDLDLGGRVAPAGVSTLGARSAELTDPEEVEAALEPLLPEPDAADSDDEANPDDASVESATAPLAGTESDTETDEDFAAQAVEPDGVSAAPLGAADTLAESQDEPDASIEGSNEDGGSTEYAGHREHVEPEAPEAAVVFEPGLPLREVPVPEVEAGTGEAGEAPGTTGGADVPTTVTESPDLVAKSNDNGPPSLEELKAEMEATLGLGVTAIPIAQDEAPLRAEGTSASPPPLPAQPDTSVPEDDASAAAAGSVLETAPVDISPETWSEPVSTLELAPDPPEEPRRAETRADAADAPVDVNSLSPEPNGAEAGLSALDTRGIRAQGPFEGVPDLETVLAEAGIEEVVPPPLDDSSRSIGGERDNMLLFEPEDHERGR